MYDAIIVHKGRTVELIVDLGIDVSTDTFESEIRIEPEVTSTKIAEWTVNFLTDGTDGKLILSMTDLVTGVITHANGWMDVKRITGGQAVNCFDNPLPVSFKGVVTE